MVFDFVFSWVSVDTAKDILQQKVMTDTGTLRHTLLRDFSCVTVGMFSAVV